MPLISALCLLALIPQSLKIKGLVDLPAEQRLAASANFLSDLKMSGTPIYEPDPANKDATLVTFVWKGDTRTFAVAAMVDVARDWISRRMWRIEGTDLWYRTYSVPSDSRFYYQVASIDKAPSAEEENNWFFKDENNHGDPLNPNGITIGRTRRFAFAELPRAPKLTIYEKRQAVPKGKFEPSRTSAFVLSPEGLGKHKVWIYTPANLDPKKPCNLIVFLDGSGQFQLIDSITLLDNLIADKKIDQTIGIYADSPDRGRDLACSDAYLKFLTNELMPWVSKRYSVRFAPKRTIVNGASLGGLFSAYAVFKRPDVFGGALMQSPSLWWHPKDQDCDWLTRQFAAAKGVRGRFFVAPGTFEKDAADPEATGIRYSSRWFRDVLTGMRVPVNYREVHGGHDPFNWQVSLPEGVIWLLGK